MAQGRHQEFAVPPQWSFRKRHHPGLWPTSSKLIHRQRQNHGQQPDGHPPQSSAPRREQASERRDRTSRRGRPQCVARSDRAPSGKRHRETPRDRGLHHPNRGRGDEDGKPKAGQQPGDQFVDHTGYGASSSRNDVH